MPYKRVLRKGIKKMAGSKAVKKAKTMVGRAKVKGGLAKLKVKQKAPKAYGHVKKHKTKYAVGGAAAVGFAAGRRKKKRNY